MTTTCVPSFFSVPAIPIRLLGALALCAPDPMLELEGEKKGAERLQK